MIQGTADGWGNSMVVGAFVFSAVMLVSFVVIESRVQNPLLRVDLFKNRDFALASAVTVVGMFGFLGTAYAISIRMGPIQGQSSMRTAVAFLLLSGIALPLLPLTHKLMAVLAPRWVLGIGFALMAAGDLWAGQLPIDDATLTAIILPMGLVGAGFAFAVSAVTAAVVETVPHSLAGMATRDHQHAARLRLHPRPGRDRRRRHRQGDRSAQLRRVRRQAQRRGFRPGARDSVRRRPDRRAARGREHDSQGHRALRPRHRVRPRLHRRRASPRWSARSSP